METVSETILILMLMVMAWLMPPTLSLTMLMSLRTPTAMASGIILTIAQSSLDLKLIRMAMV